MSETIKILSRLRRYTVDFIDDPFRHMLDELNDKAIIIADQRIASLYPNEFHPCLTKFRHILIVCNESNKTIDYVQQVIRDLVAQQVRKDDILVAVGGGIAQDIVAFVASILFRGVEWRFYPTTLLAQADSCIGSKSSINFDKFKNLIGTFTPPDAIYIATKFLQTLTQSEIRSGIGEMMHYFLGNNWEDSEKLMANFDEMMQDTSKLLPFIHKSLMIKKKIIEVDEFDTGLRHIFNYGHTFGHAVEAITNYAIPHGQAVTFGMDLANYISLQKGMIDQEVFDRMHRLLAPNIPAFVITAGNVNDYCAALSKDKKNKGNQLGCILTEGPGFLKKCFLDMDQSLVDLLLSYSAQFSLV